MWPVLLLILSLLPAANSLPLNAFLSFLERFQRPYLNDPHEMKRRQAIFTANAMRATELNAMDGNAHYSAEHSPFGDLTPEEFARHVLMQRQPVPSPEPSWMESLPEISSTLRSKSSTPPPSWDWEAHQAVTSVKDQGFLGTCWAFSAVGAIEGQMALSGYKLEDLSVEQLIECDGGADRSQKHAECGPFGGWPYLAFRYLISAGGIRTANAMPYCAGASGRAQCMPCMPDGYSVPLCGNHSDLYCDASSTAGQGRGLCSSKSGFAVTVKNYTSLPNDEGVIANTLFAVGPLSAGVSAMTLQFYHHGIWSPPNWLCDPTELDHAVLLVGYGEQQGRPFWRVKNSWGSKWGENGYFRMARGTGKCGIDRAVVAVAVKHNAAASKIVDEDVKH